MIIAFVLELFMLQADLVGVGVMTKPLDPIMVPNERGWPTVCFTGEVELTDPWTPLGFGLGSRRGDGGPMGKTVTVRLAMPSGGHDDSGAFSRLVDKPRLWVLTRIAGHNVYRGAIFDQPQEPELATAAKRMFTELDKNLSWGQPVGGLQAVAVPLSSRTLDSPGRKLAFGVRNVTDRPIYLGAYGKQFTLNVIDAKSGQPLSVDLHEKRRLARFDAPTVEDFSRIDPGQLLIVSPRGPGLAPFEELVPDNMAGRKAFRIELTVDRPADSFQLPRVWTGKIRSGPIAINTSTKPMTFNVPAGGAARANPPASSRYGDEGYAARRQARWLPTSAPAGPQDATVWQLLHSGQTYHGKNVTAYGCVFADEGVPKGSFLMFRFFVQCCIAHARPIGVLVTGKTFDGLKSGDWVRATGTFTAQAGPEAAPPVIKATRIERIEEPDAEGRYIYPTASGKPEGG